MAGPIASPNLTGIYRWHELETEGSFIYSLSPKQTQNGTIDPYILAATTLLHLLVSVSRRLLNTDISAFEYFLLSICIIAATIEEGAFLLLLVYGKDNTSPFFKTFKGFLAMVQSAPTSTLENLARLAAKPGVRSTLVLSSSDGSIIKSTGLLADSAISSSPKPSLVGSGSDQDGKSSSITLVTSSSDNIYEGGEGRTKSAQHVAEMVFNFVAAAQDFAEGMERGDDAKLLRMRTRKQEIVIVPASTRQAIISLLGALPSIIEDVKKSADNPSDAYRAFFKDPASALFIAQALTDVKTGVRMRPPFTDLTQGGPTFVCIKEGRTFSRKLRDGTMVDTLTQCRGGLLAEYNNLTPFIILLPGIFLRYCCLPRGKKPPTTRSSAAGSINSGGSWRITTEYVGSILNFRWVLLEGIVHYYLFAYGDEVYDAPTRGLRYQ
ncbi:MAG: hypothetical protein Q9226_006202 [Calogaya cf. arnoldii]